MSQIFATATTVAFQGLEARRIEVQVQMTGGTPAIVVVGLGDKTVSEARERVRAAFASIGLAIPPGRLIVNLAPAAIGALPHDALDGVVCFCEVGLDGSLASAPGALPAAMAAHVGGGLRAKPGEISLAHQGVLFLDELPEFSQQALDALRQPLETGQVLIARANHHVTYPARILLAAAMNPCRCGGGGVGVGACRRGPRCAIDYQAQLSGPLLDRIDIQLDVPPVTAADLALPSPPEGAAEAAARVMRARDAQSSLGAGLNAVLDQASLEKIATPDAPGAALLAKAAESLALSARAYHRTLKVARTIADLDGSDAVRRIHVAEAA